MPDPLPTSSTESPGRISFSIASRHKLRAAMVARAALRSRIDHQAQPSRRRRLGAPRRGDEELLADQQRRKRFVGPRDPVYVNNSLRHTELRSNVRVFEERVDETVAFGDAERSCFPQSPYQKVIVIRKADKKHQP